MQLRFLRSMSFLFLATFLSGCGLLEWKDRALNALVDRIPPDMETSLGEQILPSVLPADATLRDPDLQARLESLLKPLIERNGITQPRVRIIISRQPELNAFALPGGILIFNSGMLLAAGAPEEILGVAAHEIAHATEKHVLKSMIQSLSLAAIVTFFLGDVSELGAYILRQSQALLQTGFSRKQETEADRVGIDYLLKAHINPKGMSQFFQRLEKQKSEGASDRKLQRISAFLSTHPLTAERIRMVEERMAALTPQEKQKLKAISFDLASFQTRLGQALR